MDSKRSSLALSLFLYLNLISFSLVTSCYTCGKPSLPNLPNPNLPNPNLPNPNLPNPNLPNPNLPSTGGSGHCPRDALKLGICAKVLNGPVNAVIGTPPDIPCCTVLDGLLDLEVAVCLCTVIKANLLGLNLNIPVALSLLLNTCGKKLPTDFQCA